MKCPTCTAKRLDAITLDQGLNALECRQCGGLWMTHKSYTRWQSRFDNDKQNSAFSEVSFDMSDHKTASICPECGSILLKYRVGHGLNFYVDHCSSCGGIWLDKFEWQALQAKDLHDKIHRIFSTSWQNSERQKTSAKALEKIFRKRLGPNVYEKITEIRTWIDDHPQKQWLLAFLNQQNHTHTKPER